MKLRYLFLLPELVLLFFFVFPIFKRICNPGNLAGILVCLFLLFVTLFPQVFARWICHLWGHPGRKDRTVCGVRADGGWSGVFCGDVCADDTGCPAPSCTAGNRGRAGL